jgi:hypothetical protein
MKIDDICPDEDGNAWILESLSQLIKYLILATTKCARIKQCIVQAARPRSVIYPKSFGINVSLDKSFGSKSLNNLLSRLGFSIIAQEIIRKQSAAKINRTKLQQVDN